MKFLLPLALCFISFSCEKSSSHKDNAKPESSQLESALINSVIRIRSTSQDWIPAQPWEKTPPSNLYALGTIIAPHQVLTSGEMVANATYIELETPDGSRSTEAKIIAVDYEANLALLTVKSEEEREDFFQNTKPIEIAQAPSLGDTLQIFQVEDNSTTLETDGILQSVNVSGSFLPGQNFLTYQIKASMQSGANSYSLPVISHGALAGILLSYDSSEQISEAVSVDIISRFIEHAQSLPYQGFSSLGLSTSDTVDPSFRSYLNLKSDQGGVYIHKIRKGASGDLGGLKIGDVIVNVEGQKIDRKGYYDHSLYGSVFWSHLVRGEKATGESIQLEIIREGAPLSLKVPLSREEPMERLVPDYQFDRAPNYLVKGGMIFQELNRPLLESFGKNWASEAPLNLLDAYQNPEKFPEKQKRVIFLSGVIPTPATVGYEGLNNFIVKKVNGIEILSMKDLVQAFTKPSLNQLHSIEFLEENFTVQLDDQASNLVDEALLKRGLHQLSRIKE